MHCTLSGMLHTHCGFSLTPRQADRLEARMNCQQRAAGLKLVTFQFLDTRPVIFNMYVIVYVLGTSSARELRTQLHTAVYGPYSLGLRIVAIRLRITFIRVNIFQAFTASCE